MAHSQAIGAAYKGSRTQLIYVRPWTVYTHIEYEIGTLISKWCGLERLTHTADIGEAMHSV